jgi:GH24 family phage-related lysozyme (muramidase)
MRKVVADSFLDWNIPFEGLTTWMYLDIKGLVTTGVGNLIDPVSAAVALPWRRAGGALASDQEKRDGWALVKARQDLKSYGGSAFRAACPLYLDRSAVDALVRVRLFANDALLRQRFPGFDAWPADAQLAAHSMAWGMGAGGFTGFPRFSAAAQAQDWVTCAKECRMQPDVGGLKRRNDANQALFLAAATAADPDRLSA